MTQNIAVLDIGSSKLTVYIGQRGANNTVQVKGIGECKYDGYADGEWISKEKLPAAVAAAISAAEQSSGTKIKTLYVGVPGEFCLASCKEASISFSKRHKINDSDLDKLYGACSFPEYENEYELINVQPVSFTIDNTRKVMVPVGQYGVQLSGYLSNVFAEKKFVGTFDRIITDLGIESVDYVASALAEYLLLFPEKKRDEGVLLADVGYISSTLCLGKGDGLLDMKSFSMGGGYIEADLCNALGIPYSQAQQLKKKVIVSLDAGDDEMYEITVGDKIISFSAKIVNEVVRYRIGVIAKTLAKCISACEVKMPDYAPLYLTGGGIAFMHGVKDELSGTLNRPVEIVVPPMPQVGYPDKSSGWGLMDMILSNVMPEKETFFSKIINKIKNR
ncbi:MAG: hypothetical protein ACI4SC_06855 [Candidatus Neoclostridium sp.]